MKIVKHISFFYDPNKSRFGFINQIFKTSEGYPFKTDIFIHTNHKNLRLDDLCQDYKNGTISIVNHDLTNENPFMLTWKCRDLLSKQKNLYDIFMYVEDDIVVPREAILYWYKYNELALHQNFNLGFARTEVGEAGEFICDLMRKLERRFVFIDGKKFVINVFPYCAFWIYNKKEFNRFVNSKQFFNPEFAGNAGIRERSALGFNCSKTYKATILPVLENAVDPICKVYHLSNNYIGSNVFSVVKYDEAIDKRSLWLTSSLIYIRNKYIRLLFRISQLRKKIF